MINKVHLDKFKKLYKDKYNIDLSDEETTELATHFINLMEILIRPKSKPETEISQNNTKTYLPERREDETGRV